MLERNEECCVEAEMIILFGKGRFVSFYYDYHYFMWTIFKEVAFGS